MPMDFQNQSMACEARHAPTGLRAGRAPLVEVWKFRGLEAWSLHSASPVARLSRVLFSVAVEGLALCACTLCSPGRFSAPWSFVSLAVEGLALWACTVISKIHWQSSCRFVVLRVLRDHLKILHFSPAASPVAPQGRSVLRGRGRFGPLGLHALFSVLQGTAGALMVY